MTYIILVRRGKVPIYLCFPMAWRERHYNCLSVACRNSCGFQRILEPPSIPTSKPLRKNMLYMVNSKIIGIWTYLKATIGEFMEPCATCQNTQHQLTAVIVSQQGETCWPVRFKPMSNIKQSIHSTYFISL